MKKSHEDKVDDAMCAITQVYGDMSVDTRENVKSLEELLEYIKDLLRVLADGS